jgi:hypothetical protein
VADPRDGLTIFARTFPNAHMMAVARDRLWDYMAARTNDPRAAEPPPFTVGAGIDADSPRAFLVVITPDEHSAEVRLLIGKYVRGDELSLDEVPDDYIDGLLARRANMTKLGPLTRFDSARPMQLNADGTLEEF